MSSTFHCQLHLPTPLTRWSLWAKRTVDVSLGRFLGSLQKSPEVQVQESERVPVCRRFLRPPPRPIDSRFGKKIRNQLKLVNYGVVLHAERTKESPASHQIDTISIGEEFCLCEISCVLMVERYVSVDSCAECHSHHKLSIFYYWNVVSPLLNSHQTSGYLT